MSRRRTVCVFTALLLVAVALHTYSSTRYNDEMTLNIRSGPIQENITHESVMNGNELSGMSIRPIQKNMTQKKVFEKNELSGTSLRPIVKNTTQEPIPSLPTTKGNETVIGKYIRNNSLVHRFINKIRHQNKSLLVTVINDAYMPFLHSWLCNTMYMGIHEQLLAVTLDEKTRDEIANIWPQIQVFAMPVEGLSGDQNFSHSGYLKIMVQRTELILQILEQDVELLLFDLDQFWKSNPMPYIRNQAEDHDMAAVRLPKAPSVICGGFLYLKPTKSTIELWTTLTKKMLKLGKEIDLEDEDTKLSDKHNDQAYVSKLVNQKFAGVKLARLSSDKFLDGTWYDLHESKRNRFQFLVLHNDWIVGNKAKMDREKQFKHWFWDSDSKTCDLDLVKQQTLA